MRQSVDDGDRLAESRAEPRAQHRIERIRILQRIRQVAGPDDRLRPPVAVKVQPAIGRPSHDRRTDIEKVAAPVGARAEYGIGERHRVALAPGDMLAERRPMTRLIGRTGETRRAAERQMRIHQASRHAAEMAVAAHPFGMQQIERADIERRRYAHLPAVRDQALGEMHT